MGGEEILKPEFRGVEGEVPDKQFVVHAFAAWTDFLFPWTVPEPPGFKSTLNERGSLEIYHALERTNHV